MLPKSSGGATNPCVMSRLTKCGARAFSDDLTNLFHTQGCARRFVQMQAPARHCCQLRACMEDRLPSNPLGPHRARYDRGGTVTPTASLPMYNLPEMRAVNARFWEALRGLLLEAGLRDLPEAKAPVTARAFCGTGGGRPPPVTRWMWKRSHGRTSRVFLLIKRKGLPHLFKLKIIRRLVRLPVIDGGGAGIQVRPRRCREVRKVVGSGTLGGGGGVFGWS